MVYRDFPYNPLVDKCPVSQTGYVDLKDAFVHMTIPPQLAEAETDYNGIEDPQSILGKPRDVFEAMDMQKHISEFKAPESESESEG